MGTFTIKSCPTCGSSRIKRVRRTLKRVHNGRPYSVPNIVFYACPECGENLFDPKAMDKIQAHSPAFSKVSRAKKIRTVG